MPTWQALAARGGMALVRLATLSSPLVIFLALPPFYSGIWVQVEGAMPWLHGVSALALLGCALLVLDGSEPALKALTHPLTLIPAAIFALAVVLLPATTLPALSLLGAPEHGFGALAYLDLAALTAAAFVTCAETRWRRLSISFAALAIAGAFALDAAFRAERTWAPFFFGDYLAFYAVFAFAIVGVWARGRPGPLAIAAGLCLALSLLSSNKAAIMAIGAALVLLPVVLRDKSHRTVLALTFGLPLLVGSAIILVGSAWSETYRDGLLKLTGYGPLPSLLVDSWASMWSRAMLVVVGAQSLIDAPWRLLVGFGWGHYNEALLANLPMVEGRLHEYIGTSKVYWDAIRRVDFHSHNQYFEALLSSGLGGLMLVLGYGAALVRCAPERFRALAAVVAILSIVLQSFWFQMPHTLPVMALAVVALVGCGEMPAPIRAAPRRVAAVSGLLALVMIAAAIGSYVASSNVSAERRDLDRIVGTASGDSLPRRFEAGLEEIYDSTLLQRAYAFAKGEPAANVLPLLKSYLDRASQGAGARTLKYTISSVNTYSGIVFTIPEYAERYGSPDAEFKTQVERLIRRAPRRSDIAIPYFNHLLANGRESEVLDLSNAILADRDTDAVGLWFSGVVLLGRPSTASAGMRNLKKSLDFGIQNFMPIDPQTLRLIQE